MNKPSNWISITSASIIIIHFPNSDSHVSLFPLPEHLRFHWAYLSNPGSLSPPFQNPSHHHIWEIPLQWPVTYLLVPGHEHLWRPLFCLSQQGTGYSLEQPGWRKFIGDATIQCWVVQSTSQSRACNTIHQILTSIRGWNATLKGPATFNRGLFLVLWFKKINGQQLKSYFLYYRLDQTNKYEKGLI